MKLKQSVYLGKTYGLLCEFMHFSNLNKDFAEVIYTNLVLRASILFAASLFNAILRVIILILICTHSIWYSSTPGTAQVKFCEIEIE